MSSSPSSVLPGLGETSVINSSSILKKSYKNTGYLNYISNTKLLHMEQQNSLLGTEEQPLLPPTSDEKTMGILSHILTLVAGFIAPLVIYLIKKDESKFIAEHAKESLNFQITLFIVCIVLAITIIGLALIWIPLIASLIFVIIATIRASEGKLYKYPLTIRLIK